MMDDYIQWVQGCLGYVGPRMSAQEFWNAELPPIPKRLPQNLADWPLALSVFEKSGKLYEFKTQICQTKYPEKRISKEHNIPYSYNLFLADSPQSGGFPTSPVRNPKHLGTVPLIGPGQPSRAPDPGRGSAQQPIEPLASTDTLW